MDEFNKNFFDAGGFPFGLEGALVPVGTLTGDEQLVQRLENGEARSYWVRAVKDDGNGGKKLLWYRDNPVEEGEFDAQTEVYVVL